MTTAQAGRMSPSTPPLSCPPPLPGWQQERVEPIVATQRDEPLVLHPGRGPPKIRSTLSRRLSSPMPPGHPTQHLERQHMPLAERPWAAWLANATCNRLARGARTAGQPATPLVKVPSSQTHSSPKSTPGLLTNPVDPAARSHTQPHQSAPGRSPGDLAANGRPSPTRRRSRRPAAASIGRAVCRCLLGSTWSAVTQVRINRSPRPKHRRRSFRTFPLGRHRAHQRLADRAPMHPVGPGQGTDTHRLVAGIPADTLEQPSPSTSVLPCSAGVIDREA